MFIIHGEHEKYVSGVGMLVSEGIEEEEEKRRKNWNNIKNERNKLREQLKK